MTFLVYKLAYLCNISEGLNFVISFCLFYFHQYITNIISIEIKHSVYFQVEICHQTTRRTSTTSLALVVIFLTFVGLKLNIKKSSKRFKQS